MATKKRLKRQVCYKFYVEVRDEVTRQLLATSGLSLGPEKVFTDNELGGQENDSHSLIPCLDYDPMARLCDDHRFNGASYCIWWQTNGGKPRRWTGVEQEELSLVR